MSGWEGYIYQIQHKYDAIKSEYSKTNIVQHAAIIGNDGVAWAVSSDWPGLTEYQHPLEQEDGSFRDILVNEFKCAKEAALGKRMPTQAGIRMGNEKYIFVKNEPDTQSSYLTRQGGGGAVIANLKTGIVIGIWHKDQMMSKGGGQN